MNDHLHFTINHSVTVKRKNLKKFDNTNLYTSKVTYGSGNYSNADNAGVFQLNVNNSTSNANANIRGHLLFSNCFMRFQFPFRDLNK